MSREHMTSYKSISLPGGRDRKGDTMSENTSNKASPADVGKIRRFRYDLFCLFRGCGTGGQKVEGVEEVQVNLL